MKVILRTIKNYQIYKISRKKFYIIKKTNKMETKKKGI
jgi:hypothetical protein